MILPFILVGAFFMHVETKKYLIETLGKSNLFLIIPNTFFQFFQKPEK